MLSDACAEFLHQIDRAAALLAECQLVRFGRHDKATTVNIATIIARLHRTGFAKVLLLC